MDSYVVVRKHYELEDLCDALRSTFMAVSTQLNFIIASSSSGVSLKMGGEFIMSLLLTFTYFTQTDLWTGVHLRKNIDIRFIRIGLDTRGQALLDVR